MYLAEIHGKLSENAEAKEDILTSNVFSFFKYADRSIFLFPFLKSLKLDVSELDAKNAEFSFWPTYADRTEPDLILVVGDYYLLIEAKYHSGFGAETETTKSQLFREILGGLNEAKSLGKKFKIIEVTNHYSFQPYILNDIPAEFQQYSKWINWQQITFFIGQVLEHHSALTDETRLFATDLYRLLLRKKLRNFEGRKALAVSKEVRVIKGDLFFDAATASYRGDFIGFESLLQLREIIHPLPGSIFYSAGTSTYRGDFIGFLQTLGIYKRFSSVPPKIILFIDHPKKYFINFLSDKVKDRSGSLFFNGGDNEQR